MEQSLTAITTTPIKTPSPLRGLSGTISLSGSVLPRIYDEKGVLQYDTTVRVGHPSSRIIYAKDSDSKARPVFEDDLFPRPPQEEIIATTEATRMALEAIVNKRIQSSLPKQEGLTASQSAGSKVTTIAYEPAPTNLLINPEAPKNRIIKMVEAQTDPLDPAKFKHRKIPRGPPSPPAPILHSPIRKATPEEHKAWIVPPSISSWKNPKGYTIPLDKRLACDGRSLQESVINEKFAAFAESLYVAESHAREEVSRRNALERTLAANERIEKESQLRELAKAVRLEAQNNLRTYEKSAGQISERNQLREEMLHRRTVEFNRTGAVQRERDISEKIALNVPIASTINTSSLYDTRLFNQSEGISSGFAPSDDTYNVYEKPLFSGSASSLIYKPTLRPSELEVEEVVSDGLSRKPRAGLGTGATKEDVATHVHVQRSGPVQFERGGISGPTPDSEPSDPFGLDSFLQAAKRGRSGPS